MKVHIILLNILLHTLLLTNCIQQEPPNHEADIIEVLYPDDALRANTEVYNDYVVLYPTYNAQLQAIIPTITVSHGATLQIVDNYNTHNDTVLIVQVTSQSKLYNKLYHFVQVHAFPTLFDFEQWIQPTQAALFQNPQQQTLTWMSTNNGAAIAWSNPSIPAYEYPVRKVTLASDASDASASSATPATQSTAAQITTLKGPGNIAGGILNIPCLAGSLFLGAFNPLMGLTNPLKATLFGTPFNEGKPTALKGTYLYNPGTGDYILPDGTVNNSFTDTCTIYAILFKATQEQPFLDGSNISNSINIIAKAEILPQQIVYNNITDFQVEFIYNYHTDFHWEQLKNNQYKLTVVCAASHKGHLYQGRIGNTLTVDNLQVIYEDE